jgi:hypothetical protein
MPRVRRRWPGLSNPNRASPAETCARSQLYVGRVDETGVMVDVLQCERCGGEMRILAAMHSPDTARKIPGLAFPRAAAGASSLRLYGLPRLTLNTVRSQTDPCSQRPTWA